MADFYQIPEDAFEKLQMDAGVLLKDFDLTTGTYKNEDIICATTGGINPSCVAEYSDFAEDVDNAPNNMMEFKHLDSWTCTLSTTGLDVSLESIKLALGAADIVDNKKVVMRRKLKDTDFQDLYWAGNTMDGGGVVILLRNALSTGGFSLQTTKNGKGQVALEFTGHVSIKDQETMPMEFYRLEPPTAETPVTPARSRKTEDVA